MSCHFRSPRCLMLLCALIALGATTAEGAGLSVNSTGQAQNIPRAVAGDTNPHVGAGAQAPSRLHSNTRSIQPDAAGESTATRLLK